MSSTKLMPVLALLLPSLAACAPPYEGTPTAPAATAAVETPAALPAATSATPPATDAAGAEALRVKLEKLLAVKIDRVSPSPLPGVYEVQSGLNFGYVSADGEYLIEGDLVHVSTGEAITENSRKKERLVAVAKLGASNLIEFAPPADKIKHTITVFTDVDCGYCRMLHSQIADYNARGIAIRYAFFPRTGPNTESFRKAEVVWCSADRKTALTNAKLSGQVNGSPNCKNPVLEQYTTGASIGVRGTPALVLEDGELIPGYQPPDQLAQMLDGKAAKVAGPTDAAPKG
ncbi:MAG: DsbC family protein [Nevskiaceae bacterium]|nr:MAG: DsbC family protein [Nevskiaceae bacterium]